MWHECSPDKNTQQTEQKPSLTRRVGNLMYKLFITLLVFMIIALLFGMLWATVDHGLNTSPTRDIRYSLTKSNMLVIPELSPNCVRMSEAGIIKGTPNKDGSTSLTIDHKVTYMCNKNFIWKESRNKIDQSITQSK